MIGQLIGMLRRALTFQHSERRRAYRVAFLGPDGKPSAEGETILADLRRFCRVTDSSFVPGDPHATALNEGRREVWNRIMAHLYLSDDTIQTIVEQTYPGDAEGFGYED